MSGVNGHCLSCRFVPFGHVSTDGQLPASGVTARGFTILVSIWAFFTQAFAANQIPVFSQGCMHTEKGCRHE